MDKQGISSTVLFIIFHHNEEGFEAMRDEPKYPPNGPLAFSVFYH